MQDLIKELQKSFKQVALENKYSKANLYKRIKADILESDTNIVKMFEQAIQNINTFYNTTYWETKQSKINQCKLHISPAEAVMEVMIATIPFSDKPTMMQNIASQVGSKLGYDSIFDAVEIASELITCVAEADLIDIMKLIPKEGQQDTATLHVQSKLQLSQELINAISIMHYPIPMLCPPKPIESNFGGSYFTWDNPVILGLSFNQHNQLLAYDAINIMQNVPLSIDTDVLIINDDLRHKNRDENEEATKKFKIITSFNQFDKEVDHVTQELIDQDNKFYLPIRSDKRGRMYCAGYHISYQGNSYQKAMINFHKKQLITE